MIKSACVESRSSQEKEVKYNFYLTKYPEYKEIVKTIYSFGFTKTIHTHTPTHAQLVCCIPTNYLEHHRRYHY